MKKLKEVQATGFYVFKGRSNANSCFIEKLCHARKFLLYANYFLKNYLVIYDYLISKDGWSMVVKVNNQKQIHKATGNNEEVIWRIISERVRLFLSTFVRVTNKEKGRTGCLVHSGYERYFFDNKEEALKYISDLRNKQIKFYSRKKKYRSLKTHYRISSDVSKGSIFLCSKELLKKKREVLEFSEIFDFVDLTKLVVEEFVNSTLIQHFIPIQSKPT